MRTAIHTITDLLHLTKKVGEIKDEIMKDKPFHINVIDLCIENNLKEIAHSNILHRLLSHQPILDSFVTNILKLPRKICSSGIRPREKDNMDISIYDKDYCIIIENKINGAQDKVSQIYRYVEEARKRFNDNQILVVYLTHNHIYRPSDKSLTRNGEGKDRLPPIIENNIIIKDFAHDIYSWIKSLSETMKPDHILDSAISQYQDYLEIIFKMKPEEEEIKQQIRNAIKKELIEKSSSKEASDFASQIEVLNQSLTNIKRLNDELQQYVAVLEVKKYQNAINKELADISLKLEDLSSIKLDELGVKLNIPTIDSYLVYGYEYSDRNSRFYIGIYTTHSNINSNFKEIENIWNNQYKDNDWKPQPNWPYLKYINESQLVAEFKAIALVFRKKSMI